ncbi:MAG: hypothetical protein ACK5X3_21050, partial [Pseudomonadota bacterium]
GDANLADNTYSETRRSGGRPLPHITDFNSGNEDWAPGPDNAQLLWLYGPLPATYGVDGPEGRGNSWRIEIAPGSGTGGGGNEPPYLYSPVYDFTGTTNPLLSFEIKGQVNNGGGWNNIRVEYSLNGGASWITVGSTADPTWYGRYLGIRTGFGGFGGNTPLGDWTRVERAVCALAGQPCVRFRVGLVFRNAGLLPIEFAIDNLRIENSPNPDVMVEAILSPQPTAVAGCSFTPTTPVRVRLRNLRCTPITNVPVRVQDSGAGSSFTTGIVPNIPADGTVEYDLPGTIDLSAIGTHVLRAYPQLQLIPPAGSVVDADVTNDTARASLTVLVPTVSTYPYSENFDGGPGGWIGQGTAATNQWSWGTVPAGYAGLAAPVSNAWRMLARDGSPVGLESPIFDMTRLSDPELRMDLLLNVNPGGGWNTFRLEYSTNGGANWTPLNEANSPASFYVAPILHPSGNAWGGNSGGTWVTVRTRGLCFLGNQTCVRFRISQGFINAGVAPVQFAMDNFFLGDPLPYNVFIVGIQSPDPGNCTNAGTQSVTVVLQHDGCVPLRNIPFTLNVNGPITITRTGTLAQINGSSRALFTFAPAIDFSAVGVYTLTASFTLPADAAPGGDANLADNTYSETRRSGGRPLPHITDFNSGNEDWAPGPDNAQLLWL